jgi:hypothetical protein
MTGLYFSLQSRLARLRETGELPPNEHGADVGPSEYQKFIDKPGPMLSIGRLQNLLVPSVSTQMKAAIKKHWTDRREEYATSRRGSGLGRSRD